MTYATLELSVVCTVGTVPFSTTEFHSFVRKEGFFTARFALIPRALHLKTGACAARHRTRKTASLPTNLLESFGDEIQPFYPLA
jgi:hypothetical protein